MDGDQADKLHPLPDRPVFLRERAGESATPRWTISVEGTVRAIGIVGCTLDVHTLEGPLHAVDLEDG